MKIKEKIAGLAAETGKKAKGIADQAVAVADQNEDGKFDLADVAVIAEGAENAVKKGAQAVKDNANEKAKKLELSLLQPIFPNTLDDADFLLPKLIRVTNRDKKRAESDVCQGSIGYSSDQKGMRIVNLFNDSLDSFGLTFYPDSDCEFYYVDPSDRDRYIALDDYFGYLKIARVNELQKLAQDLGAKHFKVTYKEEKTSFSESKVKAHAKTAAAADVERTAAEKKYSTVEIAAEMECPGHEPVEPTLRYLQRDPSIQTLISMRMDAHAPLSHQKFVLKLSNSSGIKESDAVKIDAVLKGMKYSGNTTVASEAKNESRRYLEYEIDF